MSWIKTPVYAEEDAKGWEQRFTEHPAWAWQWEFEKLFDFGNVKNEGYEKWVTDDFSFTTPYGVTTTGREAAWAQVKDTYQFFSGHYHEPREFIVWETETGWRLKGRALMYVNFLVPLQGATKVKDLTGKEWDSKFPGMFTFEWVKDPTGVNGIRMKKQAVAADGFPMINELVKRGMTSFEQVATMFEERSAASK
jgi:hypothetical protein